MPLSPALTEIAFAICSPDQIPVVCKGSDYPELAMKRPIISTLPLDLETLIQQQPDLIVAERNLHNVQELEMLGKLGLHVKVVDLESFQDLYTTCDSLGVWAGRGAQADSVKRKVMEDIKPFESRYTGQGIRMGVLFYFMPVMAYGPDNWMDAKLRYLGIDNVLNNKPTSFVNLSTEETVDLPATHLGVPSGENGVPTDMEKLLLAHNFKLVRLDEDLETRPSIRLAAQLADICNGIETSRKQARKLPPVTHTK